MTSQIDPNSIDNEYPVAGQDNSTQGFRDNFSFIKINFQEAKNEITDLQNKVLLKSALTGEVLDNNLNGALLYGGRVQNFSATQLNLGSVSGSLIVNYAAGHYQIISINGSVSLSFAGFPGNNLAWIILRVEAAAGETLTLPAAVGAGGSAKSLQGIQGVSGQTITFAENGSYEFEFRTADNGATIYITDLTRSKNRFSSPIFLNNPEFLEPYGGNVSLVTTTSYFVTEIPDGSTITNTATLQSGLAGQIKVFAAEDVTDGDMTITVNNAGWQSSGTGTITFTGRGQACTLQYINNKWYCIGNNGATFA
jgi:hypothetical protein